MRVNYIDVALTVTSCAILFLTLFVGIAANLFVAWAVRSQKSLQTPNNALLVNLAVIDFLRCVIDCPLILAIFLNGDSIDKIGLSLCNVQFASFAITCCVQLLTLASISAERYQAIAHPFETTERRKRVIIWIPSTWTVAIILSIICLLVAKDSPVYVRCKGLDVKELLTYDTFGMYILIPLWAVCLVIIIGFYGRIFILVKAHSRKIFDKGTVLTLGDKNKAKSTNTTAGDDSTIKEIVKIVPEVTVKTDVARAQEEHTSTDNILSCGQKNAMSASSEIVDQTLDRHPETNDNSRVLAENSNENNLRQQAPPSPNRALVLIDLEKPVDESKLHPQPLTISETANVQPLEEKQPDPKTIPTAPEPDNQGDVDGAVCMMPPRFNADRAKKNKEGKLAKRSGYIILTFLILWTPFVLTVVTNYFLRWSSSTSVSSLFLWGKF